MSSPRLLGTITAAVLSASLLITPAQAGTKPKPYCATHKCIALTFDDGPSPYTPKLLDTLKKERVKATFFLVGQRVQKYPDVARRTVKDGHEIGNHSWSHPHLTELYEGEIAEQLTRTQDAIHKATGRWPAIMRPPFGNTDQRVADQAAALGLPQILWTGSTRDWEARDADVITKRALALARRDAVILMHDTEPETVRAAPRIVRALKKRGYQIVPFSWLLRGERLAPGETYPSAAFL